MQYLSQTLGEDGHSMCFHQYLPRKLHYLLIRSYSFFTGENLCGRLFTNNCIILHPALGQNPELSDSSEYPHFFAFKIKRKTLDAPGLKESPSQI